MKKCVLPLIVIAVLSIPASAFPSFLIELKNGQAFLTNEYWHEGKQVKFYQFGGIMGLNRSTISSITFTDAKYVDEVARPRQEEAAEKAPAESENADAPQQYNEELLRKEKQVLDLKKETTRFEYLAAKRSGDEEALGRAREELSEINRQMVALRKKVQKANNGEIPAWWLEGVE